MSVRARCGLVVAYAGATFLAFPHPLGDRVIDLGLWLGWLAPALLLLALRGLAPGRAGLVGFAAGLLAHSAVLHWIYVVTVSYGHAPPLVGVVAPVLLAVYVAMFSAAFGAAAALTPAGLLRPFALAAIWVSCDLLRSVVFTGFPWATLGYALHRDLPLMGLAPFTGVYGLSFAAALAGAGLAALSGGRRSEALAALAGVAALHLLGALGWAASAADDGAPRVRVAALQGNILQGQKWDPALAAHIMTVYEELTLRAVEQGAEIVLWPETAVPGSPDTDPALGERLTRLAAGTGATLVVGAMGVEGYVPGGDRSEVRFFDSAYALAGDGRLLDRYDKTHLVPFGEFLPFRALLGRFVSAVATGITSGDVTPGPRPRALALPRPGGEPALTAGTPICYELLFPDLMRRFAGAGAQVLLAMTNDAWYGRTGAPHQFLVITALRAAESRRWIVRAANTGVTALIDDRGRVISQTRIFERDLLVADVPLAAPGGSATFYVRHGDWFAYACGVAALAALARGLGARRDHV